MQVLIIGDSKRHERYRPDLSLPEFASIKACEHIIMPRGSSDEALLNIAPDAEVIIADAISTVSAKLINALPKLKMIHSEGVAYNAIDLVAARAQTTMLPGGVDVCNCKGVNAGAVAEQTIALMLACLRDLVIGDTAVRRGEQIQTKERMMVEGITELGDCKIGFIGAGDIAQATMLRLASWGCKTSYHKRSPLSCEQEERLGASYEPLPELLSTSDIVSLHVPVSESTKMMVNEAFLAQCKPGVILINTARGEVVNQDALCNALRSGQVSRAGLDTLYPEPVLLDNSMLALEPDIAKRVIYSAHIGGITSGTFLRAHKIIWQNIARVAKGNRPINIVN
ncbi:MAG: hypothetical protein LBG97_06685 [Coriobacteriales bacterium]|jgi:phosphoglycerate dehydrogenase-like enzyme|nr:hypothetical protein [Coriobacteriales bacterium]